MHKYLYFVCKVFSSSAINFAAYLNPINEMLKQREVDPSQNEYRIYERSTPHRKRETFM